MRKRILIILLLLLCSFAAIGGHFDRLIGKVGLDKIANSNDQYLKESFNNSVAVFLTLSVIKSGMATIEGSEAGIVVFNLEVGDIVQSVYDYVDIAWKTTLAASTILLLTRLILQTIYAIDHWFLSVLLFALTGFLVSRYFIPQRVTLSNLLKEFVVLALVVTISLYFILPFSIIGASVLSKRITLPLIEEAQSGFNTIEKDFSVESLSENIFPADEKEESFLAQINLKTQYAKVKIKLIKLATYLKDKTHSMAIWTIKIIAGYLFDCLVFPVTFFIILFIFIKGTMSYLLGVRRTETFKKDLDLMFSKYYGHRFEKRAGVEGIDPAK